MSSISNTKSDTAPVPEKKKVSSLFVNLYGLGDFGFQLMVNMELLFFMSFLTDAARFAPGTAGLIGSITGIFDIVWVFVAGLIVQKSHLRWGKLRSWLLIMPIPVWVAFIFQFWGFSGNTTFAGFLICMGFIVSHLLWNVVYTAHLSMIPQYTDDNQQRTTMSSRRMLGQSLGKIVFSVTAATLIASFGASTGSKAVGHTYTTMIMTIPMVLCYFLLFFASKKYEKPRVKGQETAEEAAAIKADKLPVWQSIKNALSNWQLVALIITDFGRGFAFYLVTAVTIYYLRVVIGNPALMPTYLLYINIAGAVSAFICPYIAKPLGKKAVYFIGLFGYAIGLILVFLFKPSAAMFMVIMIIANFLLQWSFSVSTAMFSDTVVYGEWKTKINNRGFIMGLYSLPIKTSVLARAAFMGAVLAAFNYSPDIVDATTITNISKLFTLYPAIALAVFGLFGVFFYKLTDKRVQEYSDEIAQRKLGG